MEKAKLNVKKDLFTSKLDLILKKKLVKYFMVLDLFLHVGKF
jgi:hypothetical protein